MKRIIAIFICICIILTGCQNKGKEEQTDQTSNESNLTDQTSKDNNSTDNEDNNGDTVEVENNVLQLLKLNKAWSLVQTVELSKTDYEAQTYEAEVTPYKIEKDLSNIENISQFSGFTNEQSAMLVNNGFVVLPSRNTRIYYTYDTNEYMGVPNFVTSDSVLHMYHQFFDKSLMSIEANYLYSDLELMTRQMLDKSIVLLQQLEDAELKALQEKNIVYFLVARMLMQQTTEITVEISDGLYDIAKQEYEMLQAAEGFQKSPLFEVDFDYSQCTVRGHYTRSEELSRYFRTMMWFGTAPLEFINEEKEIQYDNVIQALLISYMTFADSEVTCDAELWSNIYQPTSQYVGLSDDINVFALNGLRISVYGGNQDPNIFHDESYHDALTAAVTALPQPRIQGKFISLSAPTGLQFRFMGQRYILDSYVLQNLMEPILRPIPSALDVMGVMGSNRAEDLLFNVYKPQDTWPEYPINYQKMEEEVSGYNSDIWQENLYNGWLWSLQELLQDYKTNSGMPFFMTTDAWRNKSLNTALGSYTELKHDTVLYGKQAAAEMGGPIEYADQHYVEPNIPLYSKLLYLTDFTVSVLGELDMMNDNLAQGVNDYKEFLNLLIDCSKKELRNEPLTQEESKQLLRCGGKMEYIMTNFQRGVTNDFETIDITDMLVTDITTAPGAYLSLGTGYFDDIYVVVPVNNKLYLSRGSVYSFYEFTSDKRLTDEEWWTLQGINVVHEEYGDFAQYGEMSEDLPEQPAWISSFKADSNDVIIESLEAIMSNVED